MKCKSAQMQNNIFILLMLQIFFSNSVVYKDLAVTYSK